MYSFPDFIELQFHVSLFLSKLPYPFSHSLSSVLWLYISWLWITGKLLTSVEVSCFLGFSCFWKCCITIFEFEFTHSNLYGLLCKRNHISTASDSETEPYIFYGYSTLPSFFCLAGKFLGLYAIAQSLYLFSLG
jgi:hypothetical protein